MISVAVDMDFWMLRLAEALVDAGFCKAGRISMIMTILTSNNNNDHHDSKNTEKKPKKKRRDKNNSARNISSKNHAP